MCSPNRLYVYTAFLVPLDYYGEPVFSSAPELDPQRYTPIHPFISSRRILTRWCGRGNEVPVGWEQQKKLGHLCIYIYTVYWLNWSDIFNMSWNFPNWPRYGRSWCPYNVLRKLNSCRLPVPHYIIQGSQFWRVGWKDVGIPFLREMKTAIEGATRVWKLVT